MTSSQAGPDERRDQRAAIFVPSRFGSGQPVPPSERDNQVRIVAGVLADVFGGASAEDIAGRATPIIGTFRHDGDRSERYVDELVLRVWAAATANAIASPEAKDTVFREACRLRDALRQECVLVEWGREVLFTPSVEQTASPVSFASLDRPTQEDFALMAWHRVATPEDLSGVLSLTGWTIPSSEERHDEGDTLVGIAQSRDEPRRTAWAWDGSDNPRDSDIRRLAVGDILVMAAADSKLRVWLRTKERWAGPRDIPLATETRPAARLSIEFAIALLDGDAPIPLPQLLDTEGATGRFYREIRDLIASVAKQLPSGKSGVAAEGVAQRLVGRLLFLRFVEEKGWLPRRSLHTGWREHKGDYHRSFLRSLFLELNTPAAERSHPPAAIPYLNGGLFARRTEDEQFDLPDSCFDPGRRGTLLEVLYRYQFTLDEAAGRDQVVSVDPAMLGRVLESLTPDETRKNRGVHYTPAPIARALAVGGIYPQVVRRLRDSNIRGIDVAALERLCAGDLRAVDDELAERIRNELRELRVVDPAVGSGALLVACLEVMLELQAACSRVLGGDLRKGSRAWAEAARHFVKECLFGVDISPGAIEVAQLRLWLFLAVGERTPTALPDLGYNLRVGNALAFDIAEERLARAASESGGTARSLEFGDVERALNKALDARESFRRAGGRPPSERANSFLALEDAEHGLRRALGVKPGPAGEAPPFAWSVHFPEVFGGPNRGFDLVIANPPYVRTSGLHPAESAELKERYRSMQSKNIDLYYAFIERCLRSPTDKTRPNTRGKPDTENARGLAGRAGGIAFIMPSFAQTQSAEHLRALLAEGGHVERWIDFVDQQVFPTANNYVALLFATAERRSRKTFQAQIVTPDAFRRMRAGRPWLAGLPSLPASYRPGGWSVRPEVRTAVGATCPLAEVASVQVGIQTSLDDFYLLDEVRPGSSSELIVVKNANSEVELEKDALFACAKGSRELHGSELDQGCYVLWPYRADGSLMDQAELERRFPRAWALLCANRAILEAREKGKFTISTWWRFRRPQGVKVARQPKVLVPSMMKSPTAYFDDKGRVICTASGKGGGGGWVLQAAKGTQTDLTKLAAFLTSAVYGTWLHANAEPKKGGWWGVDRKTLERCPVPVGAF